MTETAKIQLVSTQNATAGLTPDAIIALIDEVDGGLPKVIAAIKTVGVNPLAVALLTKVFPPLAPIVPMLVQIGPYLDFFQGLVDKIDQAIHAISPPQPAT